jgi:uncharacterized membrane protein
MDNLTGLTLASITFLVVGLFLRFMTPGINRFCGYRTKTSMANQENWDYSQKYSGNLFAKFGLALLLIVLIINYTDLNISNNAGKALVAILILGSAITTIVLTEKALKKHSEK